MSRRCGPPGGVAIGPPDLLAAVRAAIDAHRPADDREEESRRCMGDHLAVLRRPFDRFAAPEHVTGSAVVVGRRGTVLHRHKRLHRWLQPGGHLDPGETPWEAALRESREETGLEVAHPPGGPRLIHLDVHRAAEGHTHLDLRYLVVAPDLDPAPPPGESPEARWFGWEEAAAVADHALVGALAAARRQPEAAPGSDTGPAPAPGGAAVGRGPGPRHNGAGTARGGDEVGGGA